MLKKILTKVKQLLRHIFLLIAILMTTTPAWAATATLGAKKQNVTADGITFSLGGSYTINNILVDYSYTGSGKEASLSWTVPPGYTISVSQIKIYAKNDKSWGITGKGQYKTSKNSSYTQFCNSNSWTNYTLNSSSYFPLGNNGSITMKAIDRELQWQDIVFTYTKTAHKYNIAFDANGGTGTTQSISNVLYDTDVKLTPNGFTRNKFTITYDANGGTCATAQEIRNYTFAGWAETSTGNVKYSDQQVVRNLSATNGATVTLYAKWNEPNATITLPIATKEGAVLEGWYLGETKIGEAGDTYTPTSSVTLTAKWIEKYTPEITGSNATMLVGDELLNAFTFKNTLNPTAVITTKSISDIRDGDKVITYDAAENKIIAHNAGIAEIYFYQAPTTTIEEGYSATYTITVTKHSIEADIAQTTAVWNELIDNAFTLTDNLTDYKVESKNPTIAQYLVGNKIQTYYTSGSANFQITRPEDRKYKALNQTLTLTVNQSKESCDIFNDSTERNFSTGITDFTGKAGYAYEIPENTRVYADSVYITAKRNGENNFYLQYSINGGNKWTDFPEEELNLSTNYQTFGVKIPDSIIVTHIRPFAKTGATLRKDYKDFRVTRKQYITPSVAEGATLTLPTVAINQDCSATFNLSWSTCSSIAIESSNSKFTVTPSQISNTGGTQTITVQCNTSEVDTYNGIITIYDQSSKKSFNVTATVNDKWTPVMTGQESYRKFIGDTWVADFAFQNTETEKPSADSNAPFYFEIDHQQFVNTDQSTRNPDHLDEIISYNQETNEITAHNAGTAVLTFIQKDTPGYYSGSRSCTITVAKHTPIFTWEDPVYFNQKISDYFTTDNRDTEITISQPSTDEDVAILYFDPENEEDKHTLDLTTYYKETTPLSSTQVTVSQAENWYWYAYEEPYTITPRNQDNHVTFTLTQDNYIRDFQVPGGFSDPWADSNGPTWTEGGIHFGQGGLGSGEGGWNWNDKYIIIEFTGIPDSLFFSTTTSTGATTNNPLTSDDDATNTKLFYVSAGSTKENLQEIWSSSDNNNTYQDAISPDTRFLKLCYTGNLEGWFKNVTVTELNQFKFTPDTLEFGTIHITDNTTKTLTTNFQYANAGHKINIDLDRTGEWENNEAYELAKKYIAINPASITDIGGEKVGEKEIQITLHSDDKTPYAIPEGAKIKIWDEAGRCDYLTISGLIKPSEQEIIWIPYFQREEPIAIPLETGDVKNAARATSNLPITYETDKPDVIQISADKSYFTPIAVGDATITAIQEGDQKYSRVTSSKKITVTQKMVQIISWSVDFTDLILVDNPDPIALDAKVYLLDLVNNRPVFSQEQTDKIVYSVENEDVVKIVDGQLVIVSLGSTTITAAITETEDSHYESTSLTLPVIVRKPALGCEDILLLDQSTEVEFFTDGINTNKIIKDAMAIDCTLGIPGRVEFQHKGEAWKLFGNVSFYEGSINVQQSTDGGSTWSDVQKSSVTPTLSVYKTTIAALDRNATHIRFVRPSGGQGYHYYKDVKVYPAQYMESEVSNIDFEDINIGGTYTKKINISYSNIKSPIRYESSSSDITVSPSNFGECGKFGTKELTITWKPTTKEGQQTITFIDDLSEIPDLTINLTANIFGRLQEIIWEDRPETILNHTDIDNRPTYTIDANSKESTSLKIQYEVIEGTENAYFIDDMFFLLNEGDITIKAYHPGNEEYAAVQEIYTFPIQTVPPTFIGTEDQLWNNENNWKNKIMPSEEYSIANIAAPVKIDNLHVDINNVHILDNGSIHITSTGGLDVGEGGIQASATDGSAIVIDNLTSNAGFLRISPEYKGTMPRITMRYETKSTLDNGANLDAEWQYIGAPGLNSTIYVDHNTWLYKLDETEKDWVLQPRTADVELEPFEGYAITQYGTPTYKWTADFTNQNCAIPLTYSKNGRSGRHIIANSYTAPINVAAFTGDEFEYLDGMDSKYRIEKTLYIYNSGSWNNWNNDGYNPGTSGNMSGQYYAIPVLAAQYLAEDDQEQTTIAPMQGIYLRVRSRKALLELPENGEQVGNLYLNYKSLVMGTNHEMHHPMRAPQKNIADAMHSENFRRVRIVATSENSGADRLYIIQDDINTRKYNNGYDAPNQETKGLVSIYTNESGGKMEVSCSNNIDSMYIGFMAGEDQTYTLHFSALIGDVLYLQDLMNGQEVRIVENGSYTFEADPQSTNDKRFLLLTSSKLATDISDTHTANIWYSNSTLYITNALDNSTLILYDASGHQVLSTTISHTPYTINLSYLTKGMYMARINNHVYKFVCK